MKELIKIQSELKAPKSQFNSFGNYKYRSCEDILEAVKPLLKETECLIILEDDIINMSDRVYVKAKATIINKDGISISSTALAREPLAKRGMSDEQITGSASSYARKYALNGLLAIDDAKDAETQDTNHSSAVEEIKKLIKAKKASELDFLKYFQVKAVSELTYEQQQQAIQMLQKK